MLGRNALMAILLGVALPVAPPATAQSVAWPAFGPMRDLLRFDGYADVLPDFVGPIDGSAELTIFTEGNHFPVLLPLALELFPRWCRAHDDACSVESGRILVVTLPQQMIVRMLTDGGIRLGNAVLPVGRDRPVFPDLVMGGTAPLQRLREADIVAPSARVFARSRGMAMLMRSELSGVDTLDRFAAQVKRLVVASPFETRQREQYRATLNTLIGEKGTKALLTHEITDFPGRLGIQHRDVPYALLNGLADGGLIVRHLARFYAAAFPGRLRAVDVPGAERFGQEIAMAETARARDKRLVATFERFFMEAAPAAYPEGGFAELVPPEFGRRLDL